MVELLIGAQVITIPKHLSQKSLRQPECAFLWLLSWDPPQATSHLLYTLVPPEDQEQSGRITYAGKGGAGQSGWGLR